MTTARVKRSRRPGAVPPAERAARSPGRPARGRRSRRPRSAGGGAGARGGRAGGDPDPDSPLRLGHAGQLLLGAPLEVVPALLHLLSRAPPRGDAVDLGGDALPHPPPLRHRHPPALRPVQLRVVGPHLLDEDLVLLVGEARLPQPGDLLRRRRRRRRLARHARPGASSCIGGCGEGGDGEVRPARRPPPPHPLPRTAPPGVGGRGRRWRRRGVPVRPPFPCPALTAAPAPLPVARLRSCRR
uniref:Uncharacterized protein n=1 Tax=Ornithorhynchus anatinus TaxID=9258 RepID=A0A6I8MZ68_ORNAN